MLAEEKLALEGCQQKVKRGLFDGPKPAKSVWGNDKTELTPVK